MHFRAAVKTCFASSLVFAMVTTNLRAAEPTVDDLTKTLGSGDPAAQIGAADALAELGPKAITAAPALIKALGSKNEDLQWHAAAALSEIGPAAKDAVQPLIAALKSTSPMVRRPCGTCTGRNRTCRSIGCAGVSKVACRQR